MVNTQQLLFPRRAHDEVEVSMPSLMFDFENAGDKDLIFSGFTIALAGHGGTPLSQPVDVQGALFVRHDGGVCKDHEQCAASWAKVWCGQLSGGSREPISVDCDVANVVVTAGSSRGFLLVCDGGPRSVFLSASNALPETVVQGDVRLHPWFCMFGPDGYGGALSVNDPFLGSNLLRSFRLPAGSMHVRQAEHTLRLREPEPDFRVAFKNTFLDVSDGRASPCSRRSRSAGPSPSGSPLLAPSVPDELDAQIEKLDLLINLPSGACSPIRSERLPSEDMSSPLVAQLDELNERLAHHQRRSKAFIRAASSSSVSTVGPVTPGRSDRWLDESDVEFDLAIEHDDEPHKLAHLLDQPSSPSEFDVLARRRKQHAHRMHVCDHKPTMDWNTDGKQAVTTLMLRNIPNRYTQAELISELEHLGFGSGSFDFFYLPVDKGTSSNVGYAFVNFVEESCAEKCLVVFQGHKFQKHRRSSGKTAAVSPAHIQGLEANLKHYENTAVNAAKNRQHRPVVIASMTRCLPDAVDPPNYTASDC